MSSLLDNQAIRSSALRLGTDQYHRLCDTGVIPERTELLDGIVVKQMGKSPLHTWTVEFLADWLRQHLAAEFSLRVEQPLTLEDSEPEPDLAIVVGARDDFRMRHPATAELIIEVAISTEDIDREKAAIYASAAVSEYWIVFPKQRRMVVFRKPDMNDYADVTTVDCGASIDFRDASLDTTELFPETDARHA